MPWKAPLQLVGEGYGYPSGKRNPGGEWAAWLGESPPRSSLQVRRWSVLLLETPEIWNKRQIGGVLMQLPPTTSRNSTNKF